MCILRGPALLCWKSVLKYSEYLQAEGQNGMQDSASFQTSADEVISMYRTFRLSLQPG